VCVCEREREKREREGGGALTAHRLYAAKPPDETH